MLSTVPSTAEASTTTSNSMTATLLWAPEVTAVMAPAALSAGELMVMPAARGVVPPTSATGAPFSVVLPAT